MLYMGFIPRVEKPSGSEEVKVGLQVQPSHWQSVEYSLRT